MSAVLVISDYANIVSARPEAELFISLHHRGHKLVLLVPENSPWVSRFQAEGMTIETYKIKGRKHPDEIVFIRFCIDKYSASSILLFNNRAVVNGIKAAADKSLKVVVYRGSVGNVHWYDPTSYLKVLHPRVDAILCLHDAVKTHLDKQMVFVKKRTYVMRKGHNPQWYDGIKAISREEIGVPEEAFLCIYVGNVRRVKGLKYLLQATNTLAKNPRAHLLLVGLGMEKPEYINQLKESLMSDRIHQLGFRSDALRLIAASDVLVLPSLRSEALTKAVQEAMHLGVCPVITGIPGNKGLVEEGVSGRVVPIKKADILGDVLLECSNNPEKTQHMGKQAQSHIRQWLSHQQTINMAETFLADINRR